MNSGISRGGLALEAFNSHSHPSRRRPWLTADRLLLGSLSPHKVVTHEERRVREGSSLPLCNRVYALL
jgi:hypothetical protein